MDYEAIDREMSCWIVTRLHNGTRFYISDTEYEGATDIWERARRFRYPDMAEAAAGRASNDFGWTWQVASVPEALNMRAAERGSK